MAYRLMLFLLLWVGSLAQAQVIVKQAPIGIRNSNMGNIIPNDWRKWPGAVGVDAFGHAIFKDDLHGMRAIKKVLQRYHKKHKIKTAYGIAKRYIYKEAPENCRIEYAKTLSQFTDTPPHAALDMRDRRILMALARGIVRHENGVDPYPRKLYERVFLNEP